MQEVASVTSSGSFMDWGEGEPTGGDVVQVLCCKTAFLPPQPGNVEVEVLLKKNFHYLESNNLSDKNTQNEEEIQVLDEKSLNEVEEILDKILPQEQRQDSLERRITIGEGVLELLQKLMLFDKVPEKKTPLVWNLIDSVLRHRGLEGVIQTRTELDRLVDFLLDSLSDFKDDAFVSEIRPHFQNLMFIIMSAEKSQSRDGRLILREKARDDITRLINISVLESQMKKLQYYDLMIDILEKIFPEYETYEESKNRRLLQEGIGELARKVTFSQNHERTSFGRISIRRTTVTRQMGIQDFALNVIPERNEVNDVAVANDEDRAQIQDQNYEETSFGNSSIPRTAAIRQVCIQNFAVNVIQERNEENDVTATSDEVRTQIRGKNHEEASFGKPRIRWTAGTRQMGIKDFAENVIHEGNEENEETTASDEVRAQIHGLAEGIFPSWRTSSSPRYNSIRSNFEQLLWTIYIGRRVSDESVRRELREIAKDILEDILRKADLETRFRERTSEVLSILNKIMPEEEIKSVNELKDFVRSGINDILELINPTIEIDNPYPRSSSHPQKRIRRINTPYLMVPALIDEAFKGEPVKQKSESIKSTQNLTESVIPLSEAEKSSFLTKIRNIFRKLLDLIFSRKGPKVDDGTLRQSRLTAQNILEDIVKNVHNVSERKRRELDENVDNILNSVLSTDAVESPTRRKTKLMSSIGVLFETITPSEPLDGSLIRGSIVGRVSLWPRKITLHSDIQKLVEITDHEEGIQGENIRHSVRGVMENVVPIASIKDDVLLSNLRKEGEELMVILMSFNKSVDDEDKKRELCYVAHEHVDNIISLVHQIRERCDHQNHQEKDCIISNLMPDAENLDTFERKCSIQDGIEDLLGKIHTNKSRESMMLGGSPWQKQNYFLKKSILCDAVEMFVEDLVPESEDEFTSERRNTLNHRIEDFIEVAAPPSATEDNLAKKYFRVDLRNFLQTVVNVQDIKDDYEKEKARKLVHCRLEIVLRDAEVLDTSNRCKTLDEIDYFVNALYPKEIENSVEKKRRIRFGIEELVNKILSDKEPSVVEMYDDGKKIKISAFAQKLVEMVIPNEKEKGKIERNDIEIFIQNFVDAIVSPLDTYNNTSLKETRDNLKDILGKIKQAEDAPDFESAEQVRLVAREILENILVGEEFEREMKRDQVLVDVEDILNKILPQQQIMDISKMRKSMRRGTSELIKKIVHYKEGEIMLLNRRVIPKNKIIKKDIKNIIGTTIPDEGVQHSPDRLERIRVAVSDLLEKVLPLAECQENLELRQIREKLEELLTSILPFAALDYNAHDRVALRSAVRQMLKTIMEHANTLGEKRKSSLKIEIQIILDKLIPCDDIGDDTERKRMLTEGIEDIIERIKSTIDQEYGSPRRSVTPNASVGTGETRLREEVQKLVDQAQSKPSKSDPQKELQIRHTTQELIDMNLTPADRKFSSDLFNLNESFKNLLIAALSNYAEKNPEKRSSLREEAIENLQGIIRASENHHLERRERVYGDVVGSLNKIIPLNYLGETGKRALRDGIQELFEKVIPPTKADKIDKLHLAVDTFVERIIHIEDLEEPQRGIEVNRYVTQFVDNFFAPEGSVESIKLADDLEEFLEDFVAVAQVEKNLDSRSTLRSRAQLLLERILASREERTEGYRATNTVLTYFALHQPRPILPSLTFVDHSLPFDIKRRSFFRLFPWIGKKLSRNSKPKVKEKPDEKVTNSRKEANQKKKCKEKNKDM